MKQLGEFKHKRNAEMDNAALMSKRQKEKRKKQLKETVSPIVQLQREFLKSLGISPRKVNKKLRQTKRGVTLEDCTANLLAWLETAQALYSSGDIGGKDLLVALGQVSRQFTELARLYREQGTDLPSEIKVTFEAIQKDGVDEGDALTVSGRKG